MKQVILDIETNNLLTRLLDYSTMPFKLKPEAKLWCIVVKDLETRDSILLVNKNYIDYKAPTVIKEYFKEVEVTIEDPITLEILDKKLKKEILIKTEHCINETVCSTIYAKGYTEEDGSNYTLVTTKVNPIGLQYNLLKKQVISKAALKEALKDADEIIGHNIVNFDLPMLMLFDMIDYRVGYPGEPSTIFDKSVKITDTLVWSKLLNPDRFDVFGKHSLEAWGGRTGNAKMDFNDFSQFTGHLCVYCIQDTDANCDTYDALMEEKGSWPYAEAYSMELKLIDLTLRQEVFGFELDVPLAKWCVEDLTGKMQDLTNVVNPLLPPKPLNKGEKKEFIAPKRQFKANGDVSALMEKFVERLGATLNEDNTSLTFDDKTYTLPIDPDTCLRSHMPATIDDLNHLKGHLLDLGWTPLEWKERDLTKDSKKMKLSEVKVKETIERFVNSSLDSPFLKSRLDLLGLDKPEKLLPYLLGQVKTGKPIRVPVSPMIRVGTEKSLCPNLQKMGEDADFAKDVTLYLTYKHRKNSIAGGTEDEDGEPTTGFLSLVREDGRIATPADTIGAGSFRYRHIGVVNISRVSSIYGNFMRALFRAGVGFDQLGYDFASLEARIYGSYIYNYTDGKALAASLVAEKPNDVHCYSADTQILTEGYVWKTFGELSLADKVAQWDQGIITFVNPTEIVWQDYKGKMVKFEGERVSQLLTPNHRVLVNSIGREDFLVKEAKEFLKVDNSDYILPVNGKNEEAFETDFYAAVDPLIANSRISFKNSGMMLDTKDIVERDKIQTLCHLTTRLSLVSEHKNQKGETVYRVFIAKKDSVGTFMKHVKVTQESYEGKIGCVAVPSGFIVVKKDEFISISGNTINAKKLGIDRNSAKSMTYAIMYGAQPAKLSKMLSVSLEEAERLYEAYWEAVPALRELKEKLEAYWKKTNKTFIEGIDGRKVMIRSQHSLINFLFQSGGAICAKWSTVFIASILEEQRLLGDPFIHSKLDKKIYQMICMHDEVQYATYEGFLETEYFITEEEAAEFKARNRGYSSAIGHSDKGYYVSKDNALQQAILDGIEQAVETVSLKVPLGMEWITGQSWAECH